MFQQNEQPHSPALQADEDLSARSATHPRVTIDDLKANVAELWYVNAGDAVEFTANGPNSVPHEHPLRLMTLAFVVTRSGFVVVGKSAPASPENFNEVKGRQFAYEDAIRQLWPLMGYALKERMIDGVERHTIEVG